MRKVPESSGVLVEYEVFEVPVGEAPPLGTRKPTPRRATAQRELVLPDSVSPRSAPVSATNSAISAVPPSDGRDWLFAVEEPLLAIWLLGAASMALVQARRVARFRRLVSAAWPAPLPLAEEAAHWAARMGVRPPRLSIVPGLYSPAIWALGRPRLLWPESLVAGRSLECLSGVLVHELAHLRRRDHWVGWLELLAACCWWWNPVFWLAARELRENAELASDAWVVMLLPDSRREYAAALIDVTQMVSTRPAPLPALGMADAARRTFERRLSMILRDRVACQAPLWALLALGVLAVAVLPRWSVGQDDAADFEVPAVESAADVPQRAEPRATAAPAPVLPGGVGEFNPTTGAPEGAFEGVADTIGAVGGVPMPGAPVAQQTGSELDPYRPSPRAGTPRPPTPQAPYDAQRLEQLEEQLTRLLSDVQALRAQGSALVLDSDTGELLTTFDFNRAAEEPIAQNTPAPRRPPFTEEPTAPPSVYGEGVNSDAGLTGYLTTSEPSEGVELQTLTRAKYKLSAARAEALATLLTAQTGGDVEVRVENELLVITAPPEAQQSIGAFIQFLGRYPEPTSDDPVGFSDPGDPNFPGTPGAPSRSYEPEYESAPLLPGGAGPSTVEPRVYPLLPGGTQPQPR
jgi:beta-lactamase regulating signal transducer with metallopeptidase domain